MDFSAFIVEDNLLAAKFLEEILKEQKLRVEILSSGRECLDRLEQGDVPDLLFLDVLLPDVNGLEVLEQIAKDRIPVEVVVISAVNDVATVARAYELGVREYLLKPLRYVETKARIRSLLRFLKVEREYQQNLEELQSLYRQQRRFLGVLSHDLRSPLSAIKGIAELLRDEDDAYDVEKVRSYAATIVETVDQVLNITNDLLELVKSETLGSQQGNFEQVEVLELLVRSLETFQLLAYKKGITLQLVYPENTEAVWIEADYPKLLQIVNNLVSNAIKFTPKGGRVVLELEEDPKFVKIRVRDTGIGIPEEMLPILFTEAPERRRPGTAGEKSTGLGLVIVKNFVRLHNGHLMVESEPGKGTEFTVVLPKQRLPEAEAQQTETDEVVQGANNV